MKKALLESVKKPGVCYARTVDGTELPVIDITHPAFAVNEPGVAEMDALLKKSAGDGANFNRMPPFLRAFFLWIFCRRSVLMRGLLGSSGTYLSGLNTYLLKLGPDNLGTVSTKPFDKVIAASLPALSIRLRLRDMAELTVTAVVPALERRPGAPFDLINIAGGPCSDSLNILVLLRKRRPDLLQDRAIKINVFDLESAAPAFAKNALKALLAPEAPLAGLNVAMEYVPYDWRLTSDLRGTLVDVSLRQSAVAVTAEGGLFDYGSAEDIAANLEMLSVLTPRDAALTGTITPSERPGEGFARVRGAATVARSLNDFGELVRKNGWLIAESRDRLINHVVRMGKA